MPSTDAAREFFPQFDAKSLTAAAPRRRLADAHFSKWLTSAADAA